MQEDRIKLLIDKYLSHSLTEEEARELDTFVNLHPSLSSLLSELGSPEVFVGNGQTLSDVETEETLELTMGKIHRHRDDQARTRKIGKGLAVAFLLLGLLAGTWMLTSRKTDDATQKLANTTLPAIIPAGGNKATLTLANGKKIQLDGIPDGPLSNVSEAGIVKVDSATLTYTGLPEQEVHLSGTGEGSHQPEALGGGTHTIETPRAGTFKVILADGTVVWLNNASSLRYPSSFIGTERIVYLTGEAYFDVAKDAKKPFRVDVNGVLINVLGTRFNITGYIDEKEVITTLLEGKVSLGMGTDQAHPPLRPLEQGIFTRKSIDQPVDPASWRVLKGVDTAKAVAWKENNRFYFSHADLPAVLRELSRWYDVDIEASASVPNRNIDFSVDRDHSLNWLLYQLKIAYRIEGKKIIVLR